MEARLQAAAQLQSKYDALSACFRPPNVQLDAVASVVAGPSSREALCGAAAMLSSTHQFARFARHGESSPRLHERAAPRNGLLHAA